MAPPRMALFMRSAATRVGGRGSGGGVSHLLPMLADGWQRWPSNPDAAVRFEGLEVSLDELGRDRAERRAAASAIDDIGSALALYLCTAPASNRVNRDACSSNYWVPSTPAEHLQRLESLLADAQALGEPLAHLILRGGCDAWPEEQVSEYLASALPMLSSFLGENHHVGRHEREVDTHGSRPAHLTGASHEMSRGGCLFHPHATLRALERFPPLRLSAQLTEWSLVCGRELGASGGEETCELQHSVGFHVDHLRAAGGIPESQSEGELRFWTACWDHKVRAPFTSPFARKFVDNNARSRKHTLL